MNRHPALQVIPATDADYPVVEALSSYYVYDFTEHTGWRCPETGRFGGCDALFAGWRAGTNYPYLLRVDGELAGFAAVSLRDAASREFSIEEFFVLRKFRRQGVGTAAAFHLFDQFSGKWRVEQLTANRPAMRFWERVIRAYPAAQGISLQRYDIGQQGIQAICFSRQVPSSFTFLDLPALRNGELSLELSATLPPYPDRGVLPVYDFAMQVDGQPAGNINLRVGNTYPMLMYYGHIGYGVFPTFRGHHYAERACRLILPLARVHGLDAVWITTNPDNIPSRRTCERLGARLIDTVPLPDDSDLYRAGEREKCRYRLP